MAGSFALLSARPLFALAGAPPSALPSADAVLHPVLFLILCAAAGIGSLLPLPDRRAATLRRVGGATLVLAFLILVALLIHHLNSLGRGQMSVYFWIFSAIAVAGGFRV